MFAMLEDYFISIGPFYNTLSIISRISNHLCLHDYPLNIKTRPMFCWTLRILLFAYNPNPLKTSHFNHTIELLKLWLSTFVKENN
jgi:hypothetical protein